MVLACSEFPHTGDRSTPRSSGWPSYSYGPCVAGTKRKQLAASLFRMTPYEHGLGVPTMTRWFRPERP